MHLCAIRTTLEKMERELGDVRHRVGSMERRLELVDSSSLTALRFIPT